MSADADRVALWLANKEALGELAELPEGMTRDELIEACSPETRAFLVAMESDDYAAREAAFKSYMRYCAGRS